MEAHRSGTDEVVHFIDEEHHIAVGLLHFVQDAMDSLLERPSVLCSSKQACHIKADEAFAVQPGVFLHVDAYWALWQSCVHNLLATMPTGIGYDCSTVSGYQSGRRL